MERKQKYKNSLRLNRKYSGVHFWGLKGRTNNKLQWDCKEPWVPDQTAWTFLYQQFESLIDLEKVLTWWELYFRKVNLAGCVRATGERAGGRVRKRRKEKIIRVLERKINLSHYWITWLCCIPLTYPFHQISLQMTTWVVFRILMCP